MAGSVDNYFKSQVFIRSIELCLVLAYRVSTVLKFDLLARREWFGTCFYISCVKS